MAGMKTVFIFLLFVWIWDPGFGINRADPQHCNNYYLSVRSTCCSAPVLLASAAAALPVAGPGQVEAPDLRQEVFIVFIVSCVFGRARH